MSASATIHLFVVDGDGDVVRWRFAVELRGAWGRPSGLVCPADQSWETSADAECSARDRIAEHVDEKTAGAATVIYCDEAPAWAVRVSPSGEGANFPKRKT